ncbi:MAG: helix-turn-helix domain-containing protein [Isosphaeraceae bacterium]
MPLKRIKTHQRTAAEIADEQRVRDLFQNRPSVQSLIDCGEIDRDRVTTGTAEESLLKTLSALQRARQSRGLSLTEIARRSGIDLACLSRLEGGKNPNPTFETLSRYAAALGLRLELSLVDEVEDLGFTPLDCNGPAAEPGACHGVPARFDQVRRAA